MCIQSGPIVRCNTLDDFPVERIRDIETIGHDGNPGFLLDRTYNFSEALGQQGIFPVIDRQRDETRLALGDCGSQNARQVGAVLRTMPAPTETFRKPEPFRVIELQIRVMPEMIVLLPRDQPLLFILPDDDGQRQREP